MAACLERIRTKDSSIHAWVQVLPQKPTGTGELSEIPFGVKDIIETQGLATEYGSPIYKGRIGTADAAIVRELRQLVLKEVEPGRAVFELQADERHHNPLGTLHGGVYCDLADAAMGWAYAATLPEGESFTTIELKSNFLGTATEGAIECEASAVHLGKTTQVWDATVTDGKGKTIALFRCTQMVLR